MMVRLFRVAIPSSILALLLSETILVFSCYVMAAYWTLDFSGEVFLLDEGGWWRIALVAGLIVLGLYFSDLYDNYRVRSRVALIQQYSLVIGVAFLAQALLSYGRWDVILPKWMMVYGSSLVFVLVPAWRIIFAETMWKAMGAQGVLFLGTSPAAQAIVERIQERPELGMVAVGYVTPEGNDGELTGVTHLGSASDLKKIVETRKPDRIVVGMVERRGKLPVDALLDLRFTGVRIEEIATTYETVFGRISTRELRPSQLIFSEALGPERSMVALQSVYNLVLAAIGMVLAFPVMLLVALVVRLTSRGPILFRQTRVGLNGRTFTLYKFRSMRLDAEAATGAVWAKPDDPRVTSVGRFLRTLRLDELPQLINIIRGEMSVVGPRPERPEFVKVLEEKIPYYRQRLCVKPGLTGWAQISHRYSDTVEDTITKLEYDLYYIKNLAPSLDAYIIFHTMKTVLLGRGAQ